MMDLAESRHFVLSANLHATGYDRSAVLIEDRTVGPSCQRDDDLIGVQCAGAR